MQHRSHDNPALRRRYAAGQLARMVTLLFLISAASLSSAQARQPVAAPASQAPLGADDTDGDGLSAAQEAILKTDPTNVDSDCDTLDDGTEVGSVASPTNTDGDAVIDALESSLADSNANSTSDHLDAAIVKQVTCGRFFPYAILNDGVDTTRLEVLAIGSGVTAVSAQVPSGVNLLLDGAPITTGALVTLYDNGTNGDQRASDGLWSRSGFTTSQTISFGWSLKTLFTIFQVTDGAGTANVDMDSALGGLGGVALGVAKASAAVTPTLIAANSYSAGNLVNLVDPLASLQVKGGFDDGSRLQAASQRFYQASGLLDTYDFVLFFSDANMPIPATAFYQPVRNDVQNIGRGIFDASSQYGSGGALQGVMVINFASNGPTLHELMHRWGAPNLTALGFNQCSGDTAHWGVAGLGEGQLGGFDPTTLVDNGGGSYTVSSFGTFANGGDSVDYAKLELYLAGLLDASAVPDITIPTSVSCGSISFGPGTTSFTATGLTTVTIAQIQSALGGARIPSVATSQKSFSTAAVVISQYPLSAAELAFYNEWSKNLAAPTGAGSLKSFAQATGGAATMSTTIVPAAVLDQHSYLPLVIR
jgi:hypothetical protein